MQLIIFEISNEKFGFDLTRMKEINRDLLITPVPNAPEYFKGVANLRGKIVPIIDLKKRLNLSSAGRVKNPRIIVIEIDDELLGFKVDRVFEVMRIDNNKILKLTGSSTLIDNNCIKGIIKIDSGIITLLELEKLI